jgi:hypothetical protein
MVFIYKQDAPKELNTICHGCTENTEEQPLEFNS